MTKQEVLIAGRNYIAKHGWTRGSLKNGDRVCAIGGLMYGTGINRPIQFTAAHYQAQQALQDAFACTEGTYSIPFINDNLMKSREAVLAWFDKAIEMAAND